jgi:glutamyl-tRNA reductase
VGHVDDRASSRAPDHGGGESTGVSVVVIGLNHRTAPLDVLERVHVDDDRADKALHDLAARENLSEVVVLSTCNRTEIYAVAERFHGGYGDVRDFFGELGGMGLDEFAHLMYSHHDAAAATHLFTVSAGLDSAVLGESEILGQVRVAWERAQREQVCGTTLNMLFRHAVEVGKRARTETSIGRHTASISSAAVEMATAELGSLQGRSVLVIGAGDMGEGMAVSLASAGVVETLVANRTRDRAEELASRVGGRAIALSEVTSALRNVDVLLTSTGATSIMVEHSDIVGAMADRGGRPLLIVDVAVPRDVDPSVGMLSGVTLFDLDDLRAFAERGLADRRGEISAVTDIIEHEVVRYLDRVMARGAAPLVAQLHEYGEHVRVGELERHRSRLGALSDNDRELVEQITKTLVSKLLHEPTVRLKDAAGSARGERLSESLRHLFDLS